MGSSLASQAWASASSSMVAPVPMISAMVTSSARLTALVTSSRERRRMVGPPLAQRLKQVARVNRDAADQFRNWEVGRNLAGKRPGPKKKLPVGDLAIGDLERS